MTDVIFSQDLGLNNTFMTQYGAQWRT